MVAGILDSRPAVQDAYVDLLTAELEAVAAPLLREEPDAVMRARIRATARLQAARWAYRLALEAQQ